MPLADYPHQSDSFPTAMYEQQPPILIRAIASELLFARTLLAMNRKTDILNQKSETQEKSPTGESRETVNE